MRRRRRNGNHKLKVLNKNPIKRNDHTTLHTNHIPIFIPPPPPNRACRKKHQRTRGRWARGRARRENSTRRRSHTSHRAGRGTASDSADLRVRARQSIWNPASTGKRRRHLCHRANQQFVRHVHFLLPTIQDHTRR